MTSKLTDSDKNWVAIKKGDRNIAKEMIKSLVVKLIYREELTRAERLALVHAMFYHCDKKAEEFFGYGRTGSKDTKIMESLEIHQAVTDRKKELKSKGKKVADAEADVASDLGYSERKVKRSFEDIQRRIKEYDNVMNKGIAGLIP
jgi:hypothetical protein